MPIGKGLVPRDEGSIWFKDRKVHLIIPKIIEFHDLHPVDAIKRVMSCIGLSEYDRRHICEAIFYHTDGKSLFF